MKCTNPKELFVAFPQLQEIADRLEKSEEAAKKGREKFKQTDTTNSESATNNKGYAPPHAEHFVISSIRKDSEWKNTVYTSECGKEAFINAVDKCLNNNDPDGIRIRLFPRSYERNTKNKKNQEIEIWFSREAKNEPEKNKYKEEIDQRLNGIEEKLSKSSEQPSPGSDLLMEVKLMRKDNEFTLEKIKIINEYEAKLKTLQEDNDALQSDLDDAEDEVTELREVLGKAEESLGSIHAEYEKKEKEKEENPLFTVAKQAISAGGEQAIKSLIIKNPELLDGLNFSKEQKQKFIDKLNGKAIEGEGKTEENKNGNASATDAPSGIDAEIKDKTEPHRKALKNIWDWEKQLSLDDFKIVFEINMGFSTQTGDVNKDIANPILEQIREKRKSASEEKTETAS